MFVVVLQQVLRGGERRGGGVSQRFAIVCVCLNWFFFFFFFILFIFIVFIDCPARHTSFSSHYKSITTELELGYRNSSCSSSSEQLTHFVSQVLVVEGVRVVVTVRHWCAVCVSDNNYNK